MAFRTTLRVRLLIALASTLPVPSLAQSMSAAQAEEASIAQLELEKDAFIGKGKSVGVEGTVDSEGLRFTLGGLSILQPVVVTLLARDETDDLTLALFKGDWKEARRTGSTRGGGIALFEFRTEGAVNILVRGASAATPYALLVWAGDELRPSMTDVVVTPEEFRKGKPAATAAGEAGGAGSTGDSGTSILWIVVVAVLGGAVVFLGRRLLAGRKQS